MREIRFRGWARHANTWVFGNFVRMKNEAYMVTDDDDAYEVEPESIGQALDYIDTNQNVIYEGDVLRLVFDDGRPTATARVVWWPMSAGFIFQFWKNNEWHNETMIDSLLGQFTIWYVIGNDFEQNWKRLSKEEVEK